MKPSIETKLASQRTQVETIAAARIEDDIARACVHDPSYAAKQGLCHAAIVQSPPRSHGRYGIAGVLRSPFLRLEQVDVSTASDVEGMPPRTDHSPLLAR